MNKSLLIRLCVLFRKINKQKKSDVDRAVMMVSLRSCVARGNSCFFHVPAGDYRCLVRTVAEYVSRVGRWVGLHR